MILGKAKTIETRQIAEILGGTAVLGREVATPGLLETRIREGLPKMSLRRIVQRAALDNRERWQLLHRIVPETTFRRRRFINAQECARTERLARVVATAEHIWGNAEKARQFLHASSSALDGCTVLETAMTELGARRIENLLWQLFHGLPA